MGRPREFEIDDVLDRAMRVFWAKGYEGASLDDLLTAMEIGRGSLYKAFGDKRSLYRAALQHYDSQVVDEAVRLLRDVGAGSPRRRVARLFHSAIDAVELRGDRSGCFLCNASTDQAPHDPAVAAAIRRSLARIEAAFAHVVPELPGEADAERACRAHHLTAGYVGLRVLTKIGGDTARLRALADTIIDGLWPPD